MAQNPSITSNQLEELKGLVGQLLENGMNIAELLQHGIDPYIIQVWLREQGSIDSIKKLRTQQAARGRAILPSKQYAAAEAHDYKPPSPCAVEKDNDEELEQGEIVEGDTSPVETISIPKTTLNGTTVASRSKSSIKLVKSDVKTREPHSKDSIKEYHSNEAPKEPHSYTTIPRSHVAYEMRHTRTAAASSNVSVPSKARQVYHAALATAPVSSPRPSILPSMLAHKRLIVRKTSTANSLPQPMVIEISDSEDERDDAKESLALDPSSVLQVKEQEIAKMRQIIEAYEKRDAATASVSPTSSMQAAEQPKAAKTEAVDTVMEQAGSLSSDDQGPKDSKQADRKDRDAALSAAAEKEMQRAKIQSEIDSLEKVVADYTSSLSKHDNIITALKKRVDKLIEARHEMAACRDETEAKRALLLKVLQGTDEDVDNDNDGQVVAGESSSGECTSDEGSAKENPQIESTASPSRSCSSTSDQNDHAQMSSKTVNLEKLGQKLDALASKSREEYSAESCGSEEDMDIDSDNSNPNHINDDLAGQDFIYISNFSTDLQNTPSSSGSPLSNKNDDGEDQRLAQGAVQTSDTTTPYIDLAATPQTKSKKVSEAAKTHKLSEKSVSESATRKSNEGSRKSSERPTKPNKPHARSHNMAILGETRANVDKQEESSAAAIIASAIKRPGNEPTKSHFAQYKSPIPRTDVPTSAVSVDSVIEPLSDSDDDEASLSPDSASTKRLKLDTEALKADRICLFESSGGHCNDETCTSLHFRDFSSDRP